ncbi:hypothetical protein PFISCL1PPCAC_25205, partial [Pristionchus fissidentatus]
MGNDQKCSHYYCGHIAPHPDDALFRRKDIIKFMKHIARPNPPLHHAFYDFFHMCEGILDIYCHPFEHWFAIETMSEEEKESIRKHFGMFIHNFLLVPPSEWNTLGTVEAGAVWEREVLSGCLLFRIEVLPILLHFIDLGPIV